MIRFSWVKNDGDRTENIPISTNKAINALSRKRRTPNERPDGLGGFGRLQQGWSPWQKTVHVDEDY